MSPRLRLTEAVLKTARFEEMRDWYAWFLDREPFLERHPTEPTTTEGGGQERAADVDLAFFAVHDDHPYSQILGIFGINRIGTDPGTGPGVHHLRLSADDLAHVVQQYERLADRSLFPHRTANHGQSTSFYYRDPDGNIIEISCANFATADEEAAFYASDTFQANPSGVELDHAAFVADYRSGVPVDELLALPAGG